MNARLEQYVDEMAAQMRGMSEEARQSELEELRQHLHNLVAEQQAQGKDTEAATQAAICQFGAARDVGEMLNPTGLRRRLQSLPENMVTVLYCMAMFAIATIGLRFAVMPLLNLLLPFHSPPPVMKANEHALTNPTYTLFLGFAALFLVVKRDRLQGVLRNFTLPGTVIGAATRCILAYEILSQVVFKTLFYIFDWDTSVPIALFIQPTLVPLLAGWFVGRAAPRQSVKGVCLAMATILGTNVLNSLVPSIMHRAFFWWFSISGLSFPLLTVGGAMLAYFGVLAGRKEAQRN